MMTDATAERYTVRRIGHSYPAEGARGLGFPFSQPMQLRLSESIGFQRGLDNPTPPPQEATPQWYFTDNGFHSLEGMNRSHQPLVNLALQVLDGKPGNVLDLGCGNGLLLHKILQGNSSIIPYGVEIHNNKIAHVHSFLPDYTDHFFTGDMFAVEEVWSQRYTLIIIMLGRLLEVEVEKREWLKERLRSASNLLVYVYDDYLSADQTLASLARAAGIELLSEDAGGSLSLARVIS
jgi:hypothetical protein